MKNFLVALLVLVTACDSVITDKSSDFQTRKLASGSWLFKMDIGEQLIPFSGEFIDRNGKSELIFRNGSEEIIVQNISISGDSISWILPVFGSQFKGLIFTDSLIKGFWYNASRGSDYQIPFTATLSAESRFKENLSLTPADFNGKWEVHFSPNKEDACNAIGLFNQKSNKVTGTFLTEMGDYRFLEGVVCGDTLKLSCFDGSHVFLFNAVMKEDRSLEGLFWSGNHWKESWTAKKNEAFQLIHPDSLTLLNENGAAFEFTFPDLNGKEVSFTDDRFLNKVVIVQLMGSWCPNCADETYMFGEFYNRFRKDGLEIVAVAYEKFDERAEAIKAIEHFIEGTGANYTFLYGGKASKKKASEDFSMTNGVSSFPTAFFIDRKGKVRKIHTGFYGPGTGPYYIEFKEDLELFVEKLLREEINS